MSETWLNSSVLSSELFDDRYEVYRRDRESSSLQYGKEGGGVLIAVKKIFKSKRVKHWENNCEDIWVTIALPVTRSVRQMALCAVYLPPPIGRSSLEHYLNNCNAVFEQVTDSNVYIVDDFNLSYYSGLNWNLVVDSDYNTGLPGTSEILIDFTHINSLSQLNFMTG